LFADTGHDPATELRHAFGAQGRAEGARGVDVALGGNRPVCLDRGTAHESRDVLRPPAVDVCDQDQRAVAAEQLRQRPADIAHALYEHGPPGQIVGSEHPGHAGFDPVEDADGGERPRITGATIRLAATEDVLCPFGDQIHVGLSCADIGARDEAPAQ
jgi:hypothetical protein